MSTFIEITVCMKKTKKNPIGPQWFENNDERKNWKQKGNLFFTELDLINVKEITKLRNHLLITTNVIINGRKMMNEGCHFIKVYR